MGNAVRYVASFLWGCIKAIFWSGGRLGWLWRAPAFVVFPAAYFEKPYREEINEVLSALGFTPLEWWGYLIVGLLIAAIGFVLRIAYLETSHATLRLYSTCLSDRTLFYFEVENLSSRELGRCLLKITSFKENGNSALPFAGPVALRTEQQDIKKRTGRFNLSPGEPKTLKFISCEKDPQPASLIRIHTENDEINDEIEVPGHKKYTVQIGLYGTGASVVRKYRVSIMNGQLVCLRSFGNFHFAKWNVEFSRVV